MVKQFAVLGGLSFMLLGGCASVPSVPAPLATPTPMASQSSITKAEVSPVDKKAINEAVIETNKGEIAFKFFPNEAPKTVANFIALAQKGFYDGLTFHRVVPNFVIQGGDPKGDGSGGPGYTIPAEFNSHPHLEGTVAMARAQDPNSAGSQFYICLAPAPFLDNNYTVFGQVTSGLETVHAIRVGDVMKKVTVR